jgi:nitrogen regulatory protein P-II 2
VRHLGHAGGGHLLLTQLIGVAAYAVAASRRRCCCSTRSRQTLGLRVSEKKSSAVWTWANTAWRPTAASRSHHAVTRPNWTGDDHEIIIAYIQPERLNAVKQSLYEGSRRCRSPTRWAAAAGGFHETYRGADIEVNLLKKVRIEIAVNDDYLDRTVEAIIKGAPKHGQDRRRQRSSSLTGDERPPPGPGVSLWA